MSCQLPRDRASRQSLRAGFNHCLPRCLPNIPAPSCPAAPACAVVPERIEGMPLTEVRFVNIKLITLAELKLITDRGAEGRRKLSELLEGEARLVSSVQRESVL